MDPCNSLSRKELPWLFVTRWMSRDAYMNYWFVGSIVSNAVKAELTKLEQQSKSINYSILDDYFQFKVKSAKLEPPIKIVYQSIFEDDNIETVLHKLALYINDNVVLNSTYPLPYGWTMHDEPLLFSVLNNQWQGWHVDPLLANFALASKDVQKEPTIQSHASSILYPNRFINIMFFSDFSNPKFANYYFANAKSLKQMSSLEMVQKETDLLSNQWLAAVSRWAKHRATVSCNVKKWSTHAVAPSSITLSAIFDTIKTSRDFPFVQWADDPQHILYKVHEQHDLKEKIMKEWMNLSSIPNDPAITIYGKLSQNGWLSYIHIIIRSSGHVSVRYVINHRETYSWTEVLHSFGDVKSRFIQWIGTKASLVFQEDTVCVQVPMNLRIGGTQLPEFFSFLSKQSHILINPIIESQGAASASFDYTRSMKRQKDTDLTNFVSSQINLNQPRPTIVESIADMMMTSNDEAEDIYKEIYTYLTSKDKTLKKGVGRNAAVISTRIKITRHLSGILVEISEAKDRYEVRRIVQWMHGIIDAFEKSAELPASKPAKLVPQKPAPQPKMVSDFDGLLGDDDSPPQQAQPKGPNGPNGPKGPKGPKARTPDSDSDYEDAFGGGKDDDEKKRETDFENAVDAADPLRVVKNKGDMNFLVQLQAADPGLFKVQGKYAETCQKAQLRQPVVMSPDQKKWADENGYKDGYQSALLYGSDPDKSKHNYYMCPTIWCPDSKVALSPSQLKDGCPDPKEKPWIINRKNPGKIQHADFVEPEDAKFCLPCCKLRDPNPATTKKCMAKIHGDDQPKQSERNEPKLADDTNIKSVKKKDEKYNIIVAPPLLEPGRYGSVPSAIYAALNLQANDMFKPCISNANVKTHNECLVRYGIPYASKVKDAAVGKVRKSRQPRNAVKDTFMHALGYLMLGEDSGKKELIHRIVDQMDPLTFMTLENGLVLLSFLNSDPIIPSDHIALLPRLAKWLTKHKSYSSLFGLDRVNLLASKWETMHKRASKETMYELSRQLAIFVSFKNFITHLESDEPKNTFLMNDVLKLMRTRLLVWEKDKDGFLFLRCPLYTYHDEIDSILHLSYDYVMLLHENGFYEPIELKRKGKASTTKLNVDQFPALRHLSIQCKTPANYSNPAPIEKLRLLSTLTHLRVSGAYQINTVVLNDDISILGFMTMNGLFIMATEDLQLGALLNLLKILKITSIMYYSDVNKDIEVPLSTTEWQEFKEILDELNYACPHKIQTANGKMVSIQVIIPSIVNIPAIPQRIQNGDPLYDYEQSESKSTNKWLSLQRNVASVLLQHYDEWVVPVLSMKRGARVEALFPQVQREMNLLKSFKKVRVILEELPLESKDELEHYKRTAGMNTKYPFFSMKPSKDSKKREWTFSQVAVQKKLPDEVFSPIHKSRPSVKYLQKGTHVELQTENEELLKNEKHAHPDIPAIALLTNAREELPSRWTDFTASAATWKEMTRLVMSNYTADALPALFVYMGQMISLQITPAMVANATRLFIANNMLKGKDMIRDLMSQISMQRAWRDAMKIALTKPVDMVEQIMELSYNKRVELWLDVVSNSERLYPHDVYLLVCAKIMQISILVIDYRAKTDKTKEKKVTGRGGLDDQLRAAHLYWDSELLRTDALFKERPLVILCKLANQKATYEEYQVVAHKDKVFYNHLSDAPIDVQHLVMLVKQKQQ